MQFYTYEIFICLFIPKGRARYKNNVQDRGLREKKNCKRDKISNYKCD